MKNKFIGNKKNLLIILFAIIAVTLFLINIFSFKKEKDTNIVTSSSKFYTVSNCVSRYINYLYSKDTDTILSLLSSSYIKDNNIDAQNLYSKIGELDKNYSFEARKMYQEIISDDLVKYYVFGYLVSDDMDSVNAEKSDYYIVVIIDSKDSTYSIEQYDGDIFKNGDANEK